MTEVLTYAFGGIRSTVLCEKVHIPKKKQLRISWGTSALL
jgi:hypothetical protein